MKKKRNWKLLLPMAIIISALFAIAGCQKPNSPPTPTPEAPVITVKVVPSGTLAYGDSASISWSVTGTDVTVVLNGKKVKTNETYSTGRLLADKTYHLFATNSGGTVDSSFTIKVGNWTTSTYGLISHGYWIFGSLSEKGYYNNYQWYVFTKDQTDPGYYSDAYYFHPDGVYELKNRYTGKLIVSNQWNLVGDTLTFKGGESSFVSKVTDDTLSTETSNFIVGNDGKQHLAYIRLIYIRDTTK